MISITLHWRSSQKMNPCIGNQQGSHTWQPQIQLQQLPNQTATSRNSYLKCSTSSHQRKKRRNSCINSQKECKNSTKKDQLIDKSSTLPSRQWKARRHKSYSISSKCLRTCNISPSHPRNVQKDRRMRSSPQPLLQLILSVESLLYYTEHSHVTFSYYWKERYFSLISFLTANPTSTTTTAAVSCVDFNQSFKPLGDVQQQ
jgi:hypothetical protein